MTERPVKPPSVWRDYADEILLAAGCFFIVVALWPLIGRLSLIVPGSVLLWLSMPARKPFTVERSDVPQRLRSERIDK